MVSGELLQKRMVWSSASTTTDTTRRRRSAPAPTAPRALTPTPRPPPRRPRRALMSPRPSQPRPSPADPHPLGLAWSRPPATSPVCLGPPMASLASPWPCLRESTFLRLRQTDTAPATETLTDSMIQFEHLRSEYRPPENRKFKWNWKTISTRLLGTFILQSILFSR